MCVCVVLICVAGLLYVAVRCCVFCLFSYVLVCVVDVCCMGLLCFVLLSCLIIAVCVSLFNVCFMCVDLCC